MDVVAGWFELHERFVMSEDDTARQERPFGFSGKAQDDEEELEPAISDCEIIPFEHEQLELEEETEDE